MEITHRRRVKMVRRKALRRPTPKSRVGSQLPAIPATPAAPHQAAQHSLLILVHMTISVDRLGATWPRTAKQTSFPDCAPDCGQKDGNFMPLGEGAALIFRKYLPFFPAVAP